MAGQYAWCIRRLVVAAVHNASSITDTAVARTQSNVRLTCCVLREGTLNITARSFIVCNSGDVHLITFNASKGKVFPLQARCGPEGG